MNTILTGAVLLVATLASSIAVAQSDYRHHNFCLMTGSAQECAYDTFAQCQKAMRGSTDFCEPNGPPVNHPTR